MTGFYVDADEQRQRARWAEQRLLEHSQLRPPRPRGPDPAEDESYESSLPPVFRREGYYASSRDTSTERRASRFRDGLPPPLLTPEMDPSAIPRVLPPALPALQDQQEFDRASSSSYPGYTPPGSVGSVGVGPTGPVYPPIPPGYPPLAASPPDPPEPLYRMTAQGLVPVSGTPLVLPPEVQQALVPQSSLLTPSQKKRARRKRKREGAPLSPQDSGRLAPFPLDLDVARAPSQNGLASPPPPSAVWPTPTHPEITQTRCDAEILVRMPNGSTHRLVCPLKPFPHPGQPHLVQLQSAQQDDAEIFLGFWMPGE